MFDLSGHSKGESGESGPNSKDTGQSRESFSQNMIGCPLILTGMSREMRTQMNAIVAFSFLLNKKEYSEEEREEFSNQIYSSCEQIISLFDNFLDSAIIDTGNSGTESGICNPNEEFNNLFSEFRETLKKEKYKDVILVSDNQTFQNSEYLIDTNRVTRVIRNLFQNALNNTKSGYIKIGYFIKNDKLTFFVVDSGQGYYKCKEFLQSQDMTQSLSKFNDTFTAVGMTLTRKLIQMMEGSIWIESNGLTGSGIYFSVPVSSAVNSEDAMNKFSNTMSTI
jgi:two-component system sensor histidine kinase EvgS